ncbi:Thiol-disulfide isomerase or thioredoxin [Halobacillus karajensis]|uniref:Thioredoxin n=1 Tax=Halobacillus karajensis TaxID=195088 RepID=A0A024P7N4_9BACI|nr:thioredoxin family protein [Halobacillus karajensis]CDQ21098.1 thioredoxin [Halobacillus karajensis]CDQ24838.1 thioredoxin [Halobacillus karajensis]CDQ28802.1 thioredoxin [Halobacillus karajensis]SEH96218.1 Thiol-disulfide isomerase or thioredoxin [Halobacillus karajensis]
MKKGMIIFASALVVLVIILVYVVNYQNTQKTADNPYGKENLAQSTIDQMDDPNYQNQIQPDELEEEIQSGESTTVYFYSPECVYCQRTTPRMMPIVNEYDLDVKKMNVLEFQDQMKKYGIEGTPTLIHFDNGEEQARITGEQSVDGLDEFFKNEVMNNSTDQEEE